MKPALNTFLASLACLASLANGATAVTLELQSRIGDVKTYSIKTVAEQKPALSETLHGASTTTTFTGTIRLSTQKAEGDQFEILGRFTALDLQMKMGDQKLEAGELPMMQDLKAQLLRQAITFTVSKKGEIKNVKMPVIEESEVLGGAPFFGDAGEQAKRSMESVFQHALSWLPDRPMEPGEKWERTIQSGLVTDPPLTFKMVHTLEKIEKVKGREAARIVSKIEVPHTELADGAYTFEGSGASTTYFDLKGGFTRSSKSVLTVKFASRDLPSALESTVTTDIELR